MRRPGNQLLGPASLCFSCRPPRSWAARKRTRRTISISSIGWFANMSTTIRTRACGRSDVAFGDLSSSSTRHTVLPTTKLRKVVTVRPVGPGSRRQFLQLRGIKRPVWLCRRYRRCRRFGCAFRQVMQITSVYTTWSWLNTVHRSWLNRFGPGGGCCAVRRKQQCNRL